MRKLVCIMMCALLTAGGLMMQTGASDNGDSGENVYVMKREDINVRDPYILTVDGKYYMYGTGLATGLGYGCCYSEDLENWSKPQNVFSAPEGFDGVDCFWAPECHYYNGSYWLFATYFSTMRQHRGVSIFRSSSPLGPFEEIGGGHITPDDWDAIDGTLHIDDDGQPWMVFVYEWTCAPNGTGGMAAAKLSDDFTSFVSEPTILFYADAAQWVHSGVTDGPFLYKTGEGKLLMLWSSSNLTGYCVGIAYSDDGTITGSWSHDKVPLYRRDLRHINDGGHAMLFTTNEGQLTMAIHSPNSSGICYHETAVFIPIKDTGTTLLLQDYRTNIFTRITEKIISLFEKTIEELSGCNTITQLPFTCGVNSANCKYSTY